MTAQHRAPLWAQLFIGLFYIFFVMTVFIMFDDSNGISESMKNDPNFITKMYIGQFLFQTLMFIVPVLMFAFALRHEKILFIKLNQSINVKYLLVAVFILVIALPITSYTTILNSKMHLPSFLSEIEVWIRKRENLSNDTVKLFVENRTIYNLLVNLFVIAFMAGLSEEIFFRGFIQRLFIENKVNYHVAVWITAILFSAIHLQFLGFVPRMLLGAVLGYLYVFTNNLWVPIIAHTVNNGFGVVMMHLTSNMESDPLTKNGEEQISPILVVVSAVLVIAQLIYLYKLRPKQQDQALTNS